MEILAQIGLQCHQRVFCTDALQKRQMDLHSLKAFINADLVHLGRDRHGDLLQFRIRRSFNCKIV